MKIPKDMIAEKNQIVLNTFFRLNFIILDPKTKQTSFVIKK